MHAKEYWDKMLLEELMTCSCVYVVRYRYAGDREEVEKKISIQI